MFILNNLPYHQQVVILHLIKPCTFVLTVDPVELGNMLTRILTKMDQQGKELEALQRWREEHQPLISAVRGHKELLDGGWRPLNEKVDRVERGLVRTTGTSR